MELRRAAQYHKRPEQQKDRKKWRVLVVYRPFIWIGRGQASRGAAQARASTTKDPTLQVISGLTLTPKGLESWVLGAATLSVMLRELRGSRNCILISWITCLKWKIGVMLIMLRYMRLIGSISNLLGTLIDLLIKGLLTYMTRLKGTREQSSRQNRQWALNRTSIVFIGACFCTKGKEISQRIHSKCRLETATTTNSR